MWLIFLLSAIGFGLAALLIIYVGNKVLNQMKKDDFKAEQELNGKDKTESKGEK